MWQHNAAELLYEPLRFEPACSIQIDRYHVNQACEQRFEHELRKLFKHKCDERIDGTHEERAIRIIR